MGGASGRMAREAEPSVSQQPNSKGYPHPANSSGLVLANTRFIPSLLRTFSDSSPPISKRNPAQRFRLTFTRLGGRPHPPRPTLSVSPSTLWAPFPSPPSPAILTSISSLGSCFSSLLLLSMQNQCAYSRPTLLVSEGFPDYCRPPFPAPGTSTPPFTPISLNDDSLRSGITLHCLTTRRTQNLHKHSFHCVSK